MINKKCKYCEELDVEKLFSFQRKNNSIRCICNVCKVCYSNIKREQNHKNFKYVEDTILKEVPV